ncbi:MAG: DUF4453 domain-containing protein [Pseudomonadota bacterium]
MGWRGERLALYERREVAATRFGVAETGDDLLFQFEDVLGWSFVQVMRDGEMQSLGWVEIEMSEEACTLVAG